MRSQCERALNHGPGGPCHLVHGIVRHGFVAPHAAVRDVAACDVAQGVAVSAAGGDRADWAAGLGAGVQWSAGAPAGEGTPRTEDRALQTTEGPVGRGRKASGNAGTIAELERCRPNAGGVYRTGSPGAGQRADGQAGGRRRAGGGARDGWGGRLREKLAAAGCAMCTSRTTRAAKRLKAWRGSCRSWDRRKSRPSGGSGDAAQADALGRDSGGDA